MKVLVCPHELSISGSPINAVDLAAELRELGQETLVYGRPGPLVEYVTDELRLPYVPARTMRFRPAPSRIGQLAWLARRERVDVIHAYEWPPCLDALYGAHLMGGVPLVCTVLSMGFAPLIPTTVPLLMGTHELADEVRGRWGGTVGVMEPPVDTRRDHPGIDGAEFRAAHGIEPHELLVVSVSRLAVDLKLDALVDAIDGVAASAGRFPVRLILVGDGPATSRLQERADAANRRADRTVVLLPGAMMDPRPAYAAADVVLGMGGSALRGMAFGKPLIVQGERGFARILDERSTGGFLRSGFFGVGPGSGGAALVTAGLERLLTDSDRRRHLGDLGLRLVCDRFTLRAAAERLVELYGDLAERRRPLRATVAQGAIVGGRALAVEARMHGPDHGRTRRARDAV